jgi:4-amino-4-deoxy-L-arabinose transferase-like glycosyltransferase
MSDQEWRVGVIAICVVGLVARLALVIAVRHAPLTGDPADYQRLAGSIASGHGFAPTQIASPGTPSAFRPPAYPYLLGGLETIFGVYRNVGRLLGVLLGVLTVLLTARLGEVLWDRRIGLLAGAMVAVCPSLIALNGSLMAESLFLPTELGIVLCLVSLRRGRGPVRDAVLAGALCGLAALTRTIGIVWMIPAALAIMRAPTTWRYRARSVATLLGVCALVLTPWAIRNANTFHAFVPLNTQGGWTLAGQYNSIAERDDNYQAVWRAPTLVPSILNGLRPLYLRRGGINEAQLNGVLNHDAVAFIRQHPGDVLVTSALNTLRMFNLGKSHQFTTAVAYNAMDLPGSLWGVTSITSQLLTLLALLAVAGRLTGRLRYQLGSPLIWSVPLLALAAAIPISGTVRYRVPLDPFVILLAALLIVTVLDRVRTRAE